MDYFKGWRFDRYIRAVLGASLFAAGFMIKGGFSMVLFGFGGGLLFTALSNSCPFNACAVKAPVKKEDVK